MRIADTSDRRCIQPVRIERESDFADARDRRFELRRRNAGQDEILAARQADVTAQFLCERRNLAHLLSAHQAEIDRKADVVKTALLLLVDTGVIAFGLGHGKLGKAFEREP